jgi:hypothetical protein
MVELMRRHGPSLGRGPASVCLAAVVASLLFGHAHAAEGQDLGLRKDLTKDELLKQLETRRAQVNLDSAKSEMDRAKADFDQTQRLFNEKVYAIDELNQARQTYERAALAYTRATIDLEKTRLDFLNSATLVTILEAKKYRTDDGEVMASVTIRNDSDLGKARVIMGKDAKLSDDDLASLLKVDNIIVTLRGTGAIVGDPFQHMVKELKLGQEAKLDYELLDTDLNVVTVNIEFLGVVRPYTVFLKKEALQDLPTIMSTQYAQEGELGSKIRYDLELERLARTDQSFSLSVLNLPSEITFAFLDPSSSARITQVKFTRKIWKQRLDFEVSVPEKLPQDMVDSSISFHLLVARKKHQKAIYELSKKHRDSKIPAEDIAKIQANKVELILIPKGTGELDLIIGNSFKEVQQNSPVTFKFNAMNSGTLALRRVTTELELPIDWEGSLEPAEVELLEPDTKRTITATITPPPGVTVGEYALTIRCEGHAGIETVEAEDKDFNVRISPESNVTATAILVAVLIGLVLAIAIASVKISRR